MLEKKMENKYKDFKKSDLQLKVARLQRIAQYLNIPVLVIVEGWESSGKGYLIKQLVQELNPKYFDVKVFNSTTKEESGKSSMERYWVNIPQKGHIKIFDRGQYFNLINEPDIPKEEFENSVRRIKFFEKALYDDYTVVVKLFLDVSEKTQSENIEDYLKSDYKSFYVDNYDKEQNENYEKYRKHIDKVLKSTDFNYLNWNVIDSNDRKEASKQALGILIDEMEKGIERITLRRKNGVRIKRSYEEKSHILENLDMKKSLDEKIYDENLKELQNKAADRFFEFYNKDIPIVLVFEGVDAAGKDGSIERLIKYVDPRLIKVHAISAPNELENSYNYLWRFFKKFPKNGETAVFSRSWYGRVMVERVEGFATDNEWERAYDEILEMERELYEHKTLILKFFVVIDKNEQLKRFESREENPDKQYKITAEDWRNRDKWDLYIEAMNEMLQRTNVDYAPWIIVEGNDKKYARIKVIEQFLKYSEEFLMRNK